MNQFEYEHLATMARGWKLRAATSADETEARILRSNADELLTTLRHADTEPDVTGEPTELPPMKWPSELPTGVEET